MQPGKGGLRAGETDARAVAGNDQVDVGRMMSESRDRQITGAWAALYDGSRNR
jgi:hypothetical protein